MKGFIFGLVALVFLSAILNVAAQEISKPIGIMHALPQEGALLTEIKDQQTVKHGSDKFVTGTLSGVPVVITMSGMGKVNAAITAQRLISEFQVKAIMFMGVAGGLNQTLEIGDVLIAKEALSA
jgi:adenosylhomocysteine nucleosidase